MQKAIAVKGLSLVMFSIILGAFGAHALKDYFTASQLQSFEVGVRYQMYGGLLLLIFGLTQYNLPKVNRGLNLFFIGNCFFSFSIYLLNLSSADNGLNKFIGPLTPIGGLFMISAILLLIIQILKTNFSKGREL